jgi:adenylate cyclase
VQESLRTRNLAYPVSREMLFRIGITVGDVVERDGDLLGDGVNIAARLEGLAQPGGLCVSRTVYEQVATKLSVDFADIGEQEVKNIPSPVHAYTLTLGRDNAGKRTEAQRKKPKGVRPAWPIVVIATSVGALVLASIVYVAVLRPRDASSPAADRSSNTAANQQKSPSDAPPPRQAEVLVPEAVPFISDRERAAIRADYLSAPDHKAIAINFVRSGFTTGQRDDESAKAAALENCHQPADLNSASMHCELYAVGNTVVYGRGRPPMPPEPWVIRDPTIERPFASTEVPLINEMSGPTSRKSIRKAAG